METMNFTTITVSERTRKELLKVAAELQAKSGRKVGYEEAVEYLLSKARAKEELFRKATAPLGMSVEEARKLLREGREEDRRGEKELEREYT